MVELTARFIGNILQQTLIDIFLREHIAFTQEVAIKEQIAMIRTVGNLVEQFVGTVIDIAQLHVLVADRCRTTGHVDLSVTAQFRRIVHGFHIDGVVHRIAGDTFTGGRRNDEIKHTIKVLRRRDVETGELILRQRQAHGAVGFLGQFERIVRTCCHNRSGRNIGNRHACNQRQRVGDGNGNAETDRIILTARCRLGFDRRRFTDVFDTNLTVFEVEIFNVVQRIGTFRTRDRHLTVIGNGDAVLVEVTRIKRGVEPGAAIEGVVTVTADDGVIVGTAFKRIVALAAFEDIVAAQTLNDIVLIAAGKNVVTRRTDNHFTGIADGNGEVRRTRCRRIARVVFRCRRADGEVDVAEEVLRRREGQIIKLRNLSRIVDGPRAVAIIRTEREHGTHRHTGDGDAQGFGTVRVG